MLQARRLFLSIAGYAIEIIFRKPTFNRTEEIIRASIQKSYYDFIQNKVLEKIDLTIEFQQVKNVEIITRKNNSYFINFYFYQSYNYVITYYSLSGLEFRIMLRNILMNLLNKDSGFMIHCSANLINNKASIFLGDQGAGKSTIMEILDEKFIGLADDSAYLKKEGREFYFYQSPFREKNWWVKKGAKKYKIGKIYFLKKDKYIAEKRQLISRELITNFISQCWSSDERQSTKQVSQIMDFLKTKQFFYKLQFSKNKKKLTSFFHDLSPDAPNRIK